MNKNDFLEMVVLETIMDKEDKDISDISTYSLIRSASGMWRIQIWWAGQTEKHASRGCSIPLDKNTATLRTAVDVMENLLKKGSEITLESRMLERAKKRKEKEKAKGAWAGLDD